MYGNDINTCSFCHKKAGKHPVRISAYGGQYIFCTSDCYKRWRQTRIHSCFSCGASIFGKNCCRQYGDGRYSCMTCSESAVLEKEQVADIRKKVLMWFYQNYLYHPPCGVNVDLCDRFVLRTEFEMLSDDIVGVYGVVSKKKTSHCRISILKGLRSDIFESVMAHEFAHDMMFHQWGNIDDPVIAEGYACYIESKYNAGMGRSSRNQTLLTKPEDYDPDKGDPYYDGLKLMLSIEKKSGYDGIAACINETKKHAFRRYSTEYRKLNNAV